MEDQIDNWNEEDRNRLLCAYNATHDWFLKNCQSIDPDDVSGKNVSKSIDDGRGCVYVFYGDCETIYVGQTAYPISERVRFEKSSHITQPWWNDIKKIELVNLSNQADRLMVELMLIYKLMPLQNSKPKKVDIETMTITI